MPKNTITNDTEVYRLQLIDLLENFETFLKNNDLRNQVLNLIPSYRLYCY
jgi:hypothetical protein